MSEILDKVKKEKRLIEEIETLIPGFRGYKMRELRREADKLVRDYIVRKLKEAKDNLKECMLVIAENDRAELYGLINRISALLDLVTSKIEHADYGYSGFFDAVKIKVDELEKLLEYDNSLIKSANEIVTASKSAQDLANDLKFDELSSKLREFKKLLDRFDELINQRENIILGVK